MFCSKCGARNREDAQTCVICGTALAQPPAGTSAQPSEPAQPQPAQPAQPAQPTPAQAAGQPTAQPPGAQAYPPGTVNNYLVPAILVTIFCCVPFGIVAIVFASQVNNKLAVGDMDGAISSANTAKIWTWVSFGIGLAVGVLFFLVGLLGAAAEM